jgi:hypothetical protein
MHFRSTSATLLAAEALTMTEDTNGAEDSDARTVR